MLNVELKVPDPEPDATLAACVALGAEDRGTLHQRDTYWEVTGGRMKLREELTDGSAELIAYERPPVEGRRESRFHRVPVADPAALSAALSAVLPTLGVVEKRRRLFLRGHVRVHLDDVAGLGRFVELEAVHGDAGAAPEEDPVLDEVIRALGLARRPPIAGGYLELLASRA